MASVAVVYRTELAAVLCTVRFAPQVAGAPACRVMPAGALPRGFPVFGAATGPTDSTHTVHTVALVDLGAATVADRINALALCALRHGLATAPAVAAESPTGLLAYAPATQTVVHFAYAGAPEDAATELQTLIDRCQTIYDELIAC